MGEESFGWKQSAYIYIPIKSRKNFNQKKSILMTIVKVFTVTGISVQ